MIRLLFISLFIMYAMPSCVDVVAAKPPLLNAIPVLMVKSETSSYALQIDKLQIDLTITGNIATTTFDINFYNPADKVLEGEFDFPLSDRQNIYRYALEINGVLREGVVVEKVKARVAFENTIRKGIDPGLVEKTKGNNFRTRIYPIPAKGYKRVVIGIEEILNIEKEGIVYKLPLISEQSIKQFGVTATVLKNEEKPTLISYGLSNFEFTKHKNGWVANFRAKDYMVAQTIEFKIPGNEVQLYIESHEGVKYFYGYLLENEPYKSKVNPSTITLLWDVSLSSEKRNFKKEIELLTRYFKRIENVTVTLVPFNIASLPGEQYIIKNGDAQLLLDRLKNYSLDGGTQLGALDLNQYKSDEILLFSDGLSTFGRSEMVLSLTPVTVINSSLAPDYSYLKFIAVKTNGKFININETEADIALDEMAKLPFKFINATYNGAEITDFFTQTGTELQNGFSFAGILLKGQAKVTLNFGYGNKITSSKTINIKEEGSNTGNIKRIWASTKIGQLDLGYEKNKEEITRLGKLFSIITQNTSLLVLDRLEDYVEYEITPPAELQEAYFALLKEKQIVKKNDNSIALDEAISAMDEMMEWYSQNVTLLKNNRGINNQVDSAYSNANGTFQVEANYTTSNVVLDSMSRSSFSVSAPPATQNETYYKLESQNEKGFLNLAVAKDGVTSNSGTADASNYRNDNSTVSTDKNTDGLQSQIKINEWNSDAVYLKELENTAEQYRYAKYLALRKKFNDQPSFYVDVAGFFFNKNKKNIALQVLSNTLELKLENPELLRIVANQLLEFGENNLAIEVLKEVVDIREEEPQSYRDLALAYNEMGNYQLAADLLFKVVTGTWDSRFGDLKSIALNEMNAVISSHPKLVDISKIDKKFIAFMPLDVRIIIGWSSNDSDIDLWVTDPNKEKCSYENTLTTTGGKISKDVTQGYGPEEYCIRKAKTGNYIVDVNLFGDSRQTIGGPITIKAELFTNFGRPNQQRKVIICRVTNNKEVIRIGSLQFGN